MEYLDLLYPILASFIAVFVGVSSIVFLFLQRLWFLLGHGDT
jgi:hypothetical protein